MSVITGMLFDAHHPFVDQRAYDLAINVFVDLGLTHLVLGGDHRDMLNVGKWGKNLQILDTFQDEIEKGTEDLSLLAATFKSAEKYYLFGNHEQRLESFIARKCSELWSVLDLNQLLCSSILGFNTIPFGPNQAIKLQGHLIQHEITGTATTVAQRSGESVFYGHTHKVGINPFTTLNGKEIFAYNCGWLGDINSPAFSYVKGWKNWQLAFGLIIDGFAFVIPILKRGNKYVCHAEGKTFSN
jgi:hypothetical protein